MLYSRLPRPLPELAQMGAADDPEGGPATFVGAAWLTVGLEFVNHECQRPGRHYGAKAAPTPMVPRHGALSVIRHL
jgi:hypothetical protein